MLDVVVIERDRAELMDDQARRAELTLRSIERLTHDATDDRSRMVYGLIRDALGCTRWVTGGLAEALA